MPDEPSATDRAMELLVYGPIGLAVYLRDTAPVVPAALRRPRPGDPRRATQVRRGPAGQRPRRRRVRQHPGRPPRPPRRQRRASPPPGPAPRRPSRPSGTLAGSAASRPPRPAAPGAPCVEPAELQRRVSTPASGAHLAIRDYDELSASQVVERLEGLPRAELDAIRGLRGEPPGPQHGPGQDRAAAAPGRLSAGWTAAGPPSRADLPRIAALARELHAELAALRGGDVWAAQDARPEPLEDAFAALLDRPRRRRPRRAHRRGGRRVRRRGPRDALDR